MKINFIFISLIAIIISACGQNTTKDTRQTWIYDYEEILSKDQEKILDSIIDNFESKTTNEIAIVTVDNIGKFNKLVEYAADFGDKHGIGKKDKNNGLVILVSKNMRQTFIATGYGTENILKDEICKIIVDSTMIPYFKNGDFYGGIKAGLEDCILKWE